MGQLEKYPPLHRRPALSDIKHFKWPLLKLIPHYISTNMYGANWINIPSLGAWLKSNIFKNFPKFDFLVYKLDFWARISAVYWLTYISDFCFSLPVEGGRMWSSTWAAGRTIRCPRTRPASRGCGSTHWTSDVESAGGGRGRPWGFWLNWKVMGSRRMASSSVWQF